MASVIKCDTLKSTTGNTAITISESGVPSFDVPLFDVYLSANQSVTSGALELVELDEVAVDTHGWWSENVPPGQTPPGTYRYTPQLAGYYWINGMVGVSGSNAMSLQGGYLYKNGSQYTVFHLNRATVNSSYYFTGGLPIYLNGTTDYVTLIGRITNTGSPVLVGSPLAGCRLSGYFLRGA